MELTGTNKEQTSHAFVSVPMDYLPNNVPEAHSCIKNDDGAGMEGGEGEDSHWSELS